MTMEEMYSRMDLAETLLNSINTQIGADKLISWNEMHQRMPDDFF